MTALALVPADDTLVSLAAEIALEHEAVEHAMGDALRHAIRCGELLASAKVQLSHGAWLPWLTENFPGTRQTATKYVRLYQHSDQMESAGSISEAVRSITKPRPAAAVDCDDVIDELLTEAPAGPRGESVMRASWPTDDAHRHPMVVVWGLEAIVCSKILAIDNPVDVATYERLQVAIATAIDSVLSKKE